jgi:uncharacterized protein
MLSGPAGRLEALLEEPDEAPQRAALVCHPHPLHGGTMHNKVVHRLSRALRRSHHVVLRFNFRGVNLSQGEHDHGWGETADAHAALDYLRARYPRLPYILAGFSFGSRIALQAASTRWAPGPERVIAAGFPTRYPIGNLVRALSVERVFVQSVVDEFGPKEELEAFFGTLSGARQLHWVEARNHFFEGGLDRLETVVAGLSSPGASSAPAAATRAR